MSDRKLNIGADFLPKESETYDLGNSTKKWNIDASQLTGSIDKEVLPSDTVYTNDVPNFYALTSKPADSFGNNGDVCFIYE